MKKFTYGEEVGAETEARANRKIPNFIDNILSDIYIL